MMASVWVTDGETDGAWAITGVVAHGVVIAMVMVQAGTVAHPYPVVVLPGAVVPTGKVVLHGKVAPGTVVPTGIMDRVGIEGLVGIKAQVGDEAVQAGEVKVLVLVAIHNLVPNLVQNLVQDLT